MNLELIAMIVLLIMFIIGSVISVNMGIIGFVAAFVVGSLISGLSIEEIYSVFPVDMFILLAGVTYLFAIAENNGTLDLIISGGLRLVKGKVALLPWLLFWLCALLTIVGVSAVAVAPILIPIGLRLAFQYQINPILMGLLISTGMYAGSFSPVNLFGLIVSGVMKAEGIPHSPVLFLVNCFLFYVFVAVVIFILFGGFRLFKEKSNVQSLVAATAEDHSANIDDHSAESKFTLYKGATLLGIGLLVTMALVFEMNMGFGALMIGLVLALMAPKQQVDVIKQLPWSVIILVTGIMTYVGVMDKVGSMDYMTELIASIDNTLMASLASSYIGGIISAFASTTGFLAAIIPLSAPLLQDPNLSTIGVVSSVAIAASIVDISPFSTTGAMILANAKGVNERDFFKKLLYVAGGFIALGPGLAWVLFVLIGTPW